MWYDDPFTFAIVILFILIAILFFKEFFDTSKR